LSLTCAIEIKKTPFGPLPGFCVRSVPSGTRLHKFANGTVVAFHPLLQETTFPPRKECREHLLMNIQNRLKRNTNQYNGWLSFTSFNLPAGFGSFIGNFSVPDNPASYPEVLYLFTGLQNVDWIPIVDPEPAVFDIIQPVLQYPGDSGSGWSVKSWYVTLDSNVYSSDEILVNTGEDVYGAMKNIGPSSWFIESANAVGQSTNLTVTQEEGLDLQPWAYNTLECYGCEDCSEYPTEPIHFKYLQLTNFKGKPVTPVWTVRASPNPICHEKSVVISPSTVDIHFT